MQISCLDMRRRYASSRPSTEIPKNLRSIRTAIALGETTPQAYYYLADTTRTARPEDAEAARQAIAEGIRLDPNDAWAHALAGKIALETKQPANAVEQLKEALRLRPGLVEAHYSLSIAYKKLGRQDEAATEVDLTSFHVTISPPRSIKKYARPAFRPALRPAYAR